jgi:hypothetical protein
VIIYGRILEGQDAVVVDRVVTAEFFPLEQSQVLNWDLNVYDLSSADPSTPIYTVTGQTSDILLDLSVFPGWRLDRVGGNFKQKVAKVSFGSKGNHTYQFTWTIHCTVASSIGDVPVVAIVAVDGVEGSP